MISQESRVGIDGRLTQDTGVGDRLREDCFEKHD